MNKKETQSFCLERLTENPELLENLVHIDRIKNVGFSLESYYALESVYPNIFEGIKVSRLTQSPSMVYQKEALVAIESSGLKNGLIGGAAVLGGIGLIGMIIKWLIEKVSGNGGSNSSKTKSSDMKSVIESTDERVIKRASRSQRRRDKKVDGGNTSGGSQTTSRRNEPVKPVDQRSSVQRRYEDNLDRHHREVFTAFTRTGGTAAQAEYLVETLLASCPKEMEDGGMCKLMAHQISSLRNLDIFIVWYALITSGASGTITLSSRIENPRKLPWSKMTDDLKKLNNELNALLNVSNAFAFKHQMVKFTSQLMATRSSIHPLAAHYGKLKSLRSDTHKRYGLNPSKRQVQSEPDAHWGKLKAKDVLEFNTECVKIIEGINRGFLTQAEEWARSIEKTPLSKYLAMSPSDKVKFDFVVKGYRSIITDLGYVLGTYREYITEYERISKLADKRILEKPRWS